MPDEPIRTQTAALLRGGAKVQAGTLLLYPDRLSHVGSTALMSAAYGGGALGVLIVGKLAKNKAAKKEAEGGKAVTTLALADVTELHKASQAFQRNLLEVVTSDGSAFKFAVKYPRWKPDLIDALTAAGRQVNDAGDVVTVA